jgi:ABC-type transport system involved in cytochrome bd biosynthesis fused ATPase/permease subunit
LPNQLQYLVQQTLQLLSRFIGIVVFALVFIALVYPRSINSNFLSPIFAIPGAAVFIIGLFLGQIYMTAQMSVKREMSNARSPLFSHFGAALQGITSIRAYGVEDLFKAEALKRVDKYTRSGRTFYNLNVSGVSPCIIMLSGLKEAEAALDLYSHGCAWWTFCFWIGCVHGILSGIC